MSAEQKNAKWPPEDLVAFSQRLESIDKLSGPDIARILKNIGIERVMVSETLRKLHYETAAPQSTNDLSISVRPHTELPSHRPIHFRSEIIDW